jgi:hypothetical protein
MSLPAFDPAAYVREIEPAARAGNWTIGYLSPCASSPRPWLRRAAHGSAPAPSLYLSSGIHGDETSGPLAILEMLRQPTFFLDFDVTLFPILNPDGLAAGVRGNADGIDLNRDYRDSKSAEIRSHIEVLKTFGRFDAAMYLHEDFEGIGAYLYELTDPRFPGLGAEIIAAMGRHVPIDERPIIEDVAAVRGIISRRDLISKFGSIEERPDWPEAIYLSVHHTAMSFTTETPIPCPLENRIAAQIAAVSVVMAALKKGIPRQGPDNIEK